MALFCLVASRTRSVAARLMSFKSNNDSCIRRQRRALLARAVVAALLAASVGAATAQMSIPGKFAVNAGGAAGYEIPISVPPGIAGMAPALTLEYGSQAGNGILGIGWSLGGLPIIARCPQTMAQNGVRGSINYDGNDRFCLDGQQLIAVNGNYGADGTEYRTEIESFSRVISRGTAGTGPSWFEVHTKSGQVLEFGRTTDSQIVAQGNPTARSWAVNKVSDTVGNFYTITYTNDAANGQNYPARIDYAGNSVVFTYATRPDIILAYQAGVQLKTTVLLSHVQTYAGSAMVADYQLAYQQSGVVPVSRLTGVTLCGGDGTCLPATTFTWASTGDGTFTQTSQSNVNLSDATRFLAVVGDVNGDGKSDLIIVTGNQIVTLMMNGDGTYSQANQTISFDIGSSPPNYAILGGDFNGDGKADFALVGGPILVTFLSNGNGTYAANQINIGNYGNPPQLALATGDFDGDGKSDIAMAVDTFLYTLISNGDGTYRGYTATIGTIGRPPQWAMVSGDFNGDGKSDIALIGGTTITTLLSNGDGTYGGANTTIPNVGTPPAVSINLGDFNGDGKTDIVLSAGTTISTYLSKGDGTYNLVNTAFSNGFSHALMMSADMNNDGKTDLVSTAGGTLYMFLSNGDGTYTQTSQSVPNLTFSSFTNYFGLGSDFNGDGKGDFLVAGSNTLYTMFGNGGPGNLITNITNGVGATTSITYLPLTNSGVYSKDTTSTYPTLDVIGPLYVVQRVDASNGIGGTYSTIYGYYGAKSDLTGRGFLGFRQMNTYDPQTNITTGTGFNQNFPFVGTTAWEWKGTSSQTFNSTSNTYQFANATNGTAVAPGNAPYRVSLLSSQASSWDLDGTAVPTVTTTYGPYTGTNPGYDAFNNPLSITVSSSDGYSKTTTNQYTNDTTNWFLGRLTQAQVTATAPTPPAPPAAPSPPDLTIGVKHTGNFWIGETGATYTITVTNVGSGATSGTVSFADTLPSGLTATAMAGSGWTCTLSNLTCTRGDALAASAAYPDVTLTVSVTATSPTTVTNTAIVSGGGEVNGSNNTATDPTTIVFAPDMTVAISHSGSFNQGGTGTYTITATNSGTAATTATVTVTDTLPSSLTATGISGPGWSCNLSTLACTRSDTLAAGSSYPAITLNVNVAANAPISVTNVANVSGGGELNTSNDSFSDPTVIVQVSDMTVSSLSHSGSFVQGQSGSYTITISNIGTIASSGTVTVTDTLPTGLTAASMSGSGWSCTLSSLTCTRSDALAVGAAYPAITLSVNVAGNAPASVTNSATVSGGGETNTSNDTKTDPTTILGAPDMTIVLSHSGTFTQGQTGNYTITVSNNGATPTVGSVSVTDSLPAGLTAAAMSGTGWSCTLSSVSCTRSDGLANGSSYPAITLTVNVAPTAASSVTNTASVAGGDEVNGNNDSASDPTNTAPLSVTIASNATNLNLWNYLVANGLATSGKPGSWAVTLAAGIVINASSTGSYAFDTGAVPSGSVLQITNNGTIVGAGGGGGADASATCTAGNPGAAGGPALHVQIATSVANNGNVWGGGGGGGSAGNGFAHGGGGGGGAGSPAGAGGAGSGGSQSGSAGSLSSGGAGGAGSGAGTHGGAGGGPGQAGGGGAAGNGCGAGSSGGGAGSATVGNSLITWTATGSRLGPLN